jgi:23S rRNA pseudouridine1911/1915/1917 synthase
MAVQGARGETWSWQVPEHSTNVRLDAFVHRCLPQLSRREVEKSIAARLFRVNGKIAKKGLRLSAGDRLVFKGPNDWLATRPLPDLQLDVPIVYEDSVLLALNKPAGMATHGFSGRDAKTLANFLLAKWPGLSEIGNSRWEPGLVHRLDRDTSGLVLVAKTQNAFDELRRQFRRREILKKYLALVLGQTPAEGVIEVPLMHDPRDARRMRPAEDASGKPKQKAWRAVSRFRRVGQAAGTSLVEIEMETGVTHQIRVHLATIGHPIVADRLYGAGARRTFGLERHFLHASCLEFGHPDDGRRVRLSAELPADLQKVLARLELRG